jgi:putative transposase
LRNWLAAVQSWPHALRIAAGGFGTVGRSAAYSKKHRVEEIIGKLREAEVELGRGHTVVDVCRQLGVSEQTYFRWRQEYGGLKLDQARRLKELERENGRLKRAVAELTLDKLILKEAAEGSF